MGHHIHTSLLSRLLLLLLAGKDQYLVIEQGSHSQSVRSESDAVWKRSVTKVLKEQPPQKERMQSRTLIR